MQKGTITSLHIHNINIVSTTGRVHGEGHYDGSGSQAHAGE